MQNDNLELLIGIGDIHGSFGSLKSLLESLDKEYQIFNSTGNLKNRIGLEFNGDFIDRGFQSLEVLEYVKTFCEQNPLVNAKPGNHELLALSSLDIARQILDDLNEDSSLANFVLGAYMSHSLHGMNGGDVFIKNFGETAQEAFSNYVERMSANGDLGGWIRGLNPYSIRKIGDKKVLFTHADISKKIIDSEMLEGYGEEYGRHMKGGTITLGGSKQKYDPQRLVISGTMWGRRFEKMSPSEAEELAKSLDVDYIVVGHTIQENGILNLGDRIFNIDVGMFQGNDPAAIVFDKTKVVAHYVNQRKQELVRY